MTEPGGVPSKLRDPTLPSSSKVASGLRVLLHSAAICTPKAQNLKARAAS
jgi:hypothetical protein